MIGCAAVAGVMLTCGCAEQESAREYRNPLLKGYEPWTAPATDTMVDLWYLGSTPEEFDRYWLATPGEHR